MNQIPVFCGKDCGGVACPLLAEVDNGRVTRVFNNPAGGKYLKGCQRGFDLPLTQNAPDRLLKPLIRVGERGSGQFREASWDEALTLTANRLAEIRAKYGSRSVINLSSAGSIGALHKTSGLTRRFLDLFGGATQVNSNYSNGASSFVLPYLLGDGAGVSGFDAATMQYAEMIVLWGANVLETRMGSEVPRRLTEARSRGAQIVVIDPRRSLTVKQAATWWLPIRPGTDSALMLAVLHVLISENLLDGPFIESHSVGFAELERYVMGAGGTEPHSPEWASAICGLPADEIARFARAYAAAKPAMLLPGYSIQRVFAGEESYRLTIALQVATGNFGKRGGSTGAMNNRLPSARVGVMPFKILPDQLPVLPGNRWPDIILQGKSGGYPVDIHAIYSAGANFVNQGSQVKKSIAAFQRVDFSVCHDLFLTPTARYCDVVLPVASPLEKEDIGIPWLGNYLLYKPQVLQPRGEARNDYDILCDLSERLGFLPAFSEGRTAGEWVQLFMDQSEVPDHDEFRRTGIYLAPNQERVGLADFSADPMNHPLSTPSRKVEIASEAYASETGFPAIPTWQNLPDDSRYPLRLISPKSPQRTHSQGSNLAVVRARAPHALQMNPVDAQLRGIADGDSVTLFNDNGVSRVRVSLSDDVMQGVVSLPEGIWFHLDGEGVDIDGAANMLTSTQGTLPGAACIMDGVGVEVARWKS